MGDCGLWIASRVAAKASRFDIVTANNEAFDAFQNKRKFRWRSSDLNFMGRTLPIDVLRIIEEEYEKKFRLGQLREVLKELKVVTAILRYGLDGYYQFIFSKYDEERGSTDWSYLDPQRDDDDSDDDSEYDDDDDDDSEYDDDDDEDDDDDDDDEEEITMV